MTYTKEQQRTIQRSHVSDILQGVALRDADTVYEVPKIRKYYEAIHQSLLIIDEQF